MCGPRAQLGLVTIWTSPVSAVKNVKLMLLRSPEKYTTACGYLDDNSSTSSVNQVIK